MGQMRSLDELVEQYGEWTAMSVHLGGDRYTIMPPRVDHRLRRLVQAAVDLLDKPLDQARILDLACLEGHYAIEFARHGAEAVAIEIREENLEKARFVARHLGLENLMMHQDDVRNLSEDKYGTFDLIICAGILYHLPAPDVFEFVQSIHDVCRRAAIFDTFISLSERKRVEHAGRSYWGLDYAEHDESASAEEKRRDNWASIDNQTSFWLTQPSLSRLVSDVGFTSFYECLTPACWVGEENFVDRKTFVAMKGRPVKLLTSPITDQTPPQPVPEASEYAQRMTMGAQRVRGPVFRFLKDKVPQPLKDLLKPILRTAGLLERDTTPEFLKKRGGSE